MPDDSYIQRMRAEVATKVARLLEATRLLDLNRSDGSFRGTSPIRTKNPHLSDSEIIYVIDTNVVQAFIEPKRWRESSRLFHDLLWSPTPNERQHDYTNLSHVVTAQATLLATEFVFSDELGAANKQLYMSIAHYKELESQIDRMQSKLRTMAKQLSHAQTLAMAEELDRLAELRSAPRREVERSIRDDRYFLVYGKQNVQDLNEKAFERVRDAYIVTSICRVLSTDELMEPVEQLARLMTEKLWSHLHPLDWKFKPASKDEEARLESEQSFWLERLNIEQNLRLDRLRAKGEPVDDKKDQDRRDSFLADADTLGYITWAIKDRLKANQRVVFITADGVTINMYRRWYALFGERSSFIVRPLALYGPQYNLRSSGASLARRVEVFERTRHALEASTFTVTSTLTSHYEETKENPGSRTASSRARDKFCVEVETDKKFETLDELIPTSHHGPSLKVKADELDSVADSLRWIERIVIGASPGLVAPRAEQAIKRMRVVRQLLRQPPDGRNDVLSDFIDDRL